MGIVVPEDVQNRLRDAGPRAAEEGLALARELYEQAREKAAGVYVTVNAQATYTPLVPYPTLGSSLALTAQTTARIQ